MELYNAEDFLSKLLPTLAGISTEQVYDWAETEARKISQYLSRVNAVRNSTLAINRLPTELLVEIFLYVASRSAYMSWIKTVEVCHHWRAVALATPRLWTLIEVEAGYHGGIDNFRMVQMCLQRSREASIDIHIAVRNSEEITNVVDLLLPHVERCRTLEVQELQSQSMEQLLSQFDVPMPRLERLHLTTCWTSRKAQLHFADALFPRLRSLSLSNTDVHCSPAALTSLVRLDIDDLEQKAAPSTSAILDMLVYCAALETLSVRVAFPELLGTIELDEFTSREVVSPPALRHIQLGGTSSHISYLLTHLAFAPEIILSITSALQEHELSRPFSTVIPDDRSLWPILPDIQTLELVVLEDFRLRAYPGPYDSDFDSIQCAVVLQCRWSKGYVSEYCADALRDCVEVFRTSSITTLRVEGVPGRLRATDWRNTFDHFPDLERLEIRRDMEMSFLHALLSSDSSDSKRPVIPRLKKLGVRLHWPDQPDDVLECLALVLRLRAREGSTLDTLWLWHDQEPIRDDLLQNLTDLACTIEVNGEPVVSGEDRTYEKAVISDTHIPSS